MTYQPANLKKLMWPFVAGAVKAEPKRGHGASGSATIDFAVAALVTLSFIFGILEIAMGLYTHDMLSAAARKASRWAIVRGSMCSTNTPGLDHCNATSSDIQTYVRGLGFPGLQTSSLTATATWLNVSGTGGTHWSTCSTGTCNAPGNAVQVVVSYPFTVKLPMSSNFSVTLSSTSQFVIMQ